MIHFEGQESFSQSIGEVSAKLGDAGWLAKSLPEAEVTTDTPDQAGWKVRPKFAFMAGNLDTTASVEQRSPELIVYRITSRGVGSNSTVTAELKFLPAETGTTVQWAGQLVELGGLLKLVPQALLRATAQKVIDDIWLAVRHKLASA